MKTKDQLAFRGSDAVTPVRSFVGYDSLDLLALKMLPTQLTNSPEARLNGREGKMLFEEGARGPTARSLLNKDVSASRMHVRYYQILLDHQVERLTRGRGDSKLARLYSDIVDKQHRRMCSSMDLLLKMDSLPAPRFQVHADQAAFLCQNG